MRNIRGKDRQKSFFSRFVFVFAIIIIVILFLGIVREYVKRVELDNEVAVLDQELEKLKLKKKGFLNSIEAYHSNFFIEQEARDKFNLKQPGEKVVVITPPRLSLGQMPLDPGQAQDLAGNSTTKTAIVFKNVQTWWQYFFGDRDNKSKNL